MHADGLCRLVTAVLGFVGNPLWSTLRLDGGKQLCVIDRGDFIVAVCAGEEHGILTQSHHAPRSLPNQKLKFFSGSLLCLYVHVFLRADAGGLVIEGLHVAHVIRLTFAAELAAAVGRDEEEVKEEGNHYSVSAWIGWLVGCLVGWLAGWLVGWLVGWLPAGLIAAGREKPNVVSGEKGVETNGVVVQVKSV